MVIAIEGISGAGKSTLIKRIIKKYGKQFKIHIIKHDEYDKVLRNAISRNHHESVLGFLTLHKYIQNKINLINSEFDLILLDRSIVTTLVYSNYYTDRFTYEFLRMFEYTNYPLDKVIIIKEDVVKCHDRLKTEDNYESLDKMKEFDRRFSDPALKNMIKYLNANIEISELPFDQAFETISTIFKMKELNVN
jgi:thymidylate kinase